MDYTLKQLIELFSNEPDSPIHSVQYQVGVKHQRLLARIVREYGNYQLRDIRARNLLSWHRTWMSGGKIAMALALMSRLRVLFRFGATILENPECERLCAALHKMRFPIPKPRTERLVADQVVSVRAKAHWRGWDYLALAQAFQFELMLRQKEVIGQWVPLNEQGESDVMRAGRDKWIGGLRWEQIDQNLILRQTMGKRPRQFEWDLKTKRMLMEELAILTRTPIVRLTRESLPASGPVILCEVTGWPYSTAEFRRKWRIVAKDAGVPCVVKNMDSVSAGMVFRKS